MTPHAALTTAAPSVRSLAVPAWFDAARRIAVGLMLTLAAGLKLTDPPRAVDDPGGLAAFVAQIRAQALVPHDAAAALAVAVIAAELALGFWLLSHRAPRPARAAAAALVLAFSLYLAALLLWGNPTPCGCFGRGGQESLANALARNALVLTMLAPPARPKHPPR